MTDPVRISSLPNVAQCVIGWELKKDQETTFQKAADTGTYAGALVEAWHRGVQCTVDPGQADVELAETMAAGYARDPRNRGMGDCLGGRSLVVPDLCEQTVTLTLPADVDDPTGEPVHLEGHVDQIREDTRTGILYVWDIKSSQRYRGQEWKLPYSYSLQLIGYALAASATLGREVRAGGIIAIRGYLKGQSGRTLKDDEAPDAVFQRVNWDPATYLRRLAVVPYHIGRLRAGLLVPSEGEWCSFCPGEPDTCVDEAEKRLR